MRFGSTLLTQGGFPAVLVAILIRDYFLAIAVAYSKRIVLELEPLLHTVSPKMVLSNACGKPHVAWREAFLQQLGCQSPFGSGQFKKQ